MAPTNTSELLQSARECTTLAANFVKTIEAMRNLDKMRNSGLFTPGNLTQAHMDQLGINDPSEIEKWLDLTPTLDDLHDRSLIARGLAG